MYSYSKLPMKKQLLTLGILLTMATACTQKGMFENIHVYPNTSLPLGSIVATDSALFELAGIQKNMHVGENGILTFIDSTSLTLSGMGVGTSLIELPTQQFNLNKNLSSLPSVGGFIDLPQGLLTETFTLTGLDGATVDTIIFGSGSLEVNVNGLVSVSGYDKSELKVVMSNLLYNKQPVTLTPGVPLQLGPEYMLVLEPGNQMTAGFEGRVPAMAALEGGVEIKGGDVEYIAGFFGRKNISNISRIIDASDLAEFSQNADYVRFDRPEVVFWLNNEYNAPLMADIASLRVNDTPIALKPGLQGQYIWIAPQSVTKIVINNDKTVSGNALTDALTKDFRSLTVDVNTILNPTADDLGDPAYVAPTHNSMAADDTLGGAFTVEIPLVGVLDRVSFGQELAVDLSDLGNKGTYDALSLSLSGTNSLPLELTIGVSVRKKGSEVSVPLFSEPVVFPSSGNNLPPTDPAFQPGVVNEQNLIVRALDADKIDLLLNSDTLYLNMTATSIGAAARNAATIFSPSELNLKIMAGAKLDYTVNEK